MDPPERIALFAQGFFEGAGPVLTTLMNRPIAVTVLTVDDVTPAELLREVSLPWVLAEATYARGLSGGHWLILGRSGALVLGQALAGDEDGEGLEFLPAYDEAIRETLNQVLSAASSALMPLIMRSISYEPVMLQLVEDAAALPPELLGQFERIWLVRGEATGPDGFRLDIALTIGADIARDILSVGADTAAAPTTSAEGGRAHSEPAGIDLILDVTLPVAVELGRARMQIQDILKLAPGSIVELDKSAGEPVEILINDRPIAKGEVVVIDENFGVRLTSIVTASERIKSFR